MQIYTTYLIIILEFSNQFNFFFNYKIYQNHVIYMGIIYFQLPIYHFLGF